MIIIDLLILSQFALIIVLFAQIKINFIVKKRLDLLEDFVFDPGDESFAFASDESETFTPGIGSE